MDIGSRITDWYHAHGRDLPWRETRDPYRIWIAEVVLQQTRIAQGIAYFHRFVDRFPDVQSLARAELDEVLKYWEGLGYYSRARNLHAAASQLMEEFGGEFPTQHGDLQSLKGVGPYTARAISSFAFGESVGVIDGNVLRVMSRVLGDFSPINVPATRKAFQILIDQWVKGQDSRAFNHGIMDLGSTVCTPTQPACLLCPLEDLCRARSEGSTHLLPHKLPKARRKVRYFHFFLIRQASGALLIRQRPSQGIWGGLWEIPNQEVSQAVWKQKVAAEGGMFRWQFKHVFTHFDMMVQVFELSAVQAPEWAEGQFISPEEIPIFAFAKAVLKIFDKLL